MAPKRSLVLAAFLVLVAAAGQVPRGAEAAATIPNAILVSGIVPCTTGSNINVGTAPPFPNAKVQLVCGGSVVASATADSSGAFVISLASNAVTQPSLLTQLLAGQCNVVVATPLATCNVNLGGAAGTLTAPAQVLTAAAGDLVMIGGGVATVLGGVLNVVAVVFSLL